MNMAESLGHYDYICTGPCSGAELTVIEQSQITPTMICVVY